MLEANEKRLNQERERCIFSMKEMILSILSTKNKPLDANEIWNLFIHLSKGTFNFLPLKDLPLKGLPIRNSDDLDIYLWAMLETCLVELVENKKLAKSYCKVDPKHRLVRTVYTSLITDYVLPNHNTP